MPPFRGGSDLAPLAEPPPPAPDQEGLGYLEAIYPELRDSWASFVNDCRLRLDGGHPLNRESLRAVIGLQVRADGTLASSAVAEPSGVGDFDAAAHEVVRQAAPFAPPPAALLSDDGVLHLRWAFQRDRRLAGIATARVTRVTWPPERAIPSFLAAGALDAAVARLAQEARSGTPGLAPLAEAVARTSILGALATADGDAQLAGVNAAARARLAEATERLRTLARGADEVELQRAAIAALGPVGATDSVPDLLAVVSAGGSRDPGVVAAAMRALVALGAGDRARAALTARLGAPADRRLVLTVAVDVSLPSAIDDLAALASRGDRAIRAAACTALGNAAAGTGDSRAHKVMRQHLDSTDASLRAACARGVARAGGKSRLTYWKLVKLLRDRDDRVRAAAVRAAGRLEPKRFVTELYILRGESSPQVLAAMADVYGLLAARDAVKRLEKLVASPDAGVRRQAAASLLRRREPGARAVLASLIRDPDPEVRVLAIGAVETDELTPLLEADDTGLRVAALTRYFAARGHAATVSEVSERMARSSGIAARARVAGAWLAR